MLSCFAVYIISVLLFVLCWFAVLGVVSASVCCVSDTTSVAEPVAVSVAAAAVVAASVLSEYLRNIDVISQTGVLRRR